MPPGKFLSRLIIVVLGMGGSPSRAAETVPMRLISAPALSPDGDTMVFEWCDDLWIASTDGGEAKRVVDDPGRDAYPRFTPDGKRIVFSSDRTGSMEIYSKPIGGGETIRHSWQSEGNELECLSSDGKRAIVRGIREHTGFLETRLMEIDLTRDLRERRLFDATATTAAWSPDGGRILFCKGGEQLYRKGYHGSRSSGIWLYQNSDRSFTRVSPQNAEERSPLWLPDGHGFYFVSNRDGASNLWLKRDGQEDMRITGFGDDGVIAPDLSADGGTLVFRVGLGVYRFRPNTDKDPVHVELWTRETLPDVSIDRRKITGTVSADFTADLKQVIFSAAGELWRIREAGGKAERLTTSAESEDDVRFSPDGGWLYYLRDDGIEANYHRARLEDLGLLDDQPVTGGERLKCRLKPSPDGSRIAWVEGTGNLWVATADGTNPHKVFDCWDKPTFDWSPDGAWLAVAAVDSESNRDIWLVQANGEIAARNITWHPSFDGSPKWSPDGRWLVFSSRRTDNGKSTLWKIDLKAGGFPDRIHVFDAKLIPTATIEPTRVVWSPDSKSLWFQGADEDDPMLYQIPIAGGAVTNVARSRGVPIRFARDGSLLWNVNRRPEVLTKSGSLRFPIDFEVERPREDVLTLGFRRIWRTLGERYYDASMNGRDWKQMRMKYERAAREARSSVQFDRVISLMRGELNASHLAFHRSRWPEESVTKQPASATAHPGIVFEDDDRSADSPLRVKRVIAGSPVAGGMDAPRPGDNVLRIAGKPVGHRTPLHEFFDGSDGKSLPLVLLGPEGRERTIEVRCISYRTVRRLEEVDSLRRQRVSALSTGAGSYIQVPDMSRETIDDVALRIFRERDREGLILDLRGNVGGREADRLLNLFCQPNHAFTVPRGGPPGYPIDRRISPSWNKPFVVLCDQDTFSNAEIFCHAVKHLKLAPLVGTATAGGVISAVKVTIPDVGELQVPFRGWFERGSGLNMDEQGAQPDVTVNLTPADQDAGKDPQLEKALEILRSKVAPGR